MARRVVLAAAALLLVTACGGPQLVVDTDGPFELRLVIDAERYAPGEPIRAVGAVTYGGELPSVVVAADANGLITFTTRQLDGPLRMGGVSRLMIEGYELVAGHPHEEAFTKTVGFTADDPDAALYQAWFDDPVFWLPAGRWEIDATVRLTHPGPAGPVERELSTSVTVLVE
jgi:hypothetical protein